MRDARPAMVLALVLAGAALGGRTALAAAPTGAVTRPSPHVLPLPEESRAVAGRDREAPPCPAPRARRFGGRRIAYAAEAIRPLVAYARPGKHPLARFGLLNANRFPTIFGVVGEVVGTGCRPLWYRVQLPVRPNGTVGYVRSRNVRLGAVSTRIHVDLSSRRLDVFSAGRLIRRLKAAIGAPGTPTPTGRYYVNQLLRAADPSGPWGPGGLGISAFSPVLVDWPQGGPIGVHGTNLPASIGRATSNGCLRVANRTVEWLFRHVPAGTPVVITP